MVHYIKSSKRARSGARPHSCIHTRIHTHTQHTHKLVASPEIIIAKYQELTDTFLSTFRRHRKVVLIFKEQQRNIKIFLYTPRIKMRLTVADLCKRSLTFRMHFVHTQTDVLQLEVFFNIPRSEQILLVHTSYRNYNHSLARGLRQHYTKEFT